MYCCACGLVGPAGSSHQRKTVREKRFHLSNPERQINLDRAARFQDADGTVDGAGGRVPIDSQQGENSPQIRDLDAPTPLHHRLRLEFRKVNHQLDQALSVGTESRCDKLKFGRFVGMFFTTAGSLRQSGESNCQKMHGLWVVHVLYFLGEPARAKSAAAETVPRAGCTGQGAFQGTAGESAVLHLVLPFVANILGRVLPPIARRKPTIYLLPLSRAVQALEQNPHGRDMPFWVLAGATSFRPGPLANICFPVFGALL